MSTKDSEITNEKSGQDTDNRQNLPILGFTGFGGTAGIGSAAAATANVSGGQSAAAGCELPERKRKRKSKGKSGMYAAVKVKREEVRLEDIKDDSVVLEFSFSNKLRQAEEWMKNYYVILKNELLSYGGVKSRLSATADTFRKTKVMLAKISVVGRSLRLHLALPLDEYDQGKYCYCDFGKMKLYADVPFTVKPRTDIAVRKACYLISELMAKHNLVKNADYVRQEFDDMVEPIEGAVMVNRFKDKISALRGEGNFGGYDDYTSDEPAAIVPATAASDSAVAENAEPTKQNQDAQTEIVSESAPTEKAAKDGDKANAAKPSKAVKSIRGTKSDAQKAAATPKRKSGKTGKYQMPKPLGEEFVITPTLDLTVLKFHYDNKLRMSEPWLKEYYVAIKNRLLCYKGVKGRMSRECETFRKSNQIVARISIVGRSLRLHLPLSFDDYEQSKYNFSDFGKMKMYAEVPFTVKPRTDVGLKKALSLIDDAMKKMGLEQSKRYAYRTFAEDLDEIEGAVLINRFHPEEVDGEVKAVKKVNMVYLGDDD